MAPLEQKTRIAILGGGISGLATAWYLCTADPNLEVAVFERDQRWGGKIETEKLEGYTLELGAEATMAQKPEVATLCREVGLEAELVGTRPQSRRVYLWDRGGLRALPEGLTMLVPTQILPFILSPIVSPLGKLRMGLEWFIPVRPGEEDESIGAFVRRRLGQEAVDRLGQPILGSIFSGDIDRLSLLATLPHLRDMEKKYGGLLRGMLRAPRPKSSGGSAFLSLKQGLGQLTTALVDALQARQVALHAGWAVTGVQRDGDGWSVHFDQRAAWQADVCVVALPAPHAAPVLRTLDADLASALEQIHYGSSATVSLAFPRAAIAHPLDGSGFVVAPRAGRRLVACTWSSTKWNDRTPDGHVLVRASLTPALAQTLSDEDMVRVALEDLSAALGVRGAPVLQRVARYLPSTPHYEVGHLQRVEAIEKAAARHPGLRLTGNAYRGSGIPDCIRHARQTATAILQAHQVGV